MGHLDRLEQEVALFEKRIAKIKANPDPRKARSNLLYYELQYARRKHQVERLHAHTPIVDCSGHFAPLVRTMGLVPMDYTGIADRLSATGGVDVYFERVRQMGFPDNLCDRTVVQLPMVIDGEMPPPSFSILSNHGCEAHQFSSMALCRHFGVPYFNIDIPPDEPNLETLAYVTAQLRDLIRVIETEVPGAKFTEGILAEHQEAEREFHHYLHEIYLARKAAPCPEAPQDVFRIPPQPSNFPDPWKVVEYGKARRDDVLERTAKGIGGVKEEHLRIMWTNTAPYHANIFDLLADRGVSVLFFYHGHAARAFGVVYGNIGDEAEFGRKLTPLEEQARVVHGLSWGGLTKRWNDHACKICRDLDIDAIVDFQQEGCVQVVGWQKLMDDAVEGNLGIPILHVPGRMLDTSRYDAESFSTRLMGFVDRCIEARRTKHSRG